MKISTNNNTRFIMNVEVPRGYLSLNDVILELGGFANTGNFKLPVYIGN